MPVLSMPIQVSFAALADPSGVGGDATAGATSTAVAMAAELAAFEKLSARVGAHSCRVYACGEGHEVVVAESPGHLGIGGKVKEDEEVGKMKNGSIAESKQGPYDVDSIRGHEEAR